MTIEIVGAVYCPLSPRDPHQSLRSLIEQTHSRLVLAHTMTSDRFNSDDSVTLILVDVDLLSSAMSSCSWLLDEPRISRLASVLIMGDNIAYVIFTSGSTGTPKAVG